MREAIQDSSKLVQELWEAENCSICSGNLVSYVVG
jgi:hypothetical protein